VRKAVLPLIIVGCLSFAFPALNIDNNNAAATASSSVTTVLTSSAAHSAKESVDLSEKSIDAASAVLYNKLQLAKLGMAPEAMRYAYKGYQQLLEKGAVKRSNVLTVVDFSQSSRRKRMYVIDLDKEEVLINTYVAHGKNTGLDMAKSFSNRPESLQSSLGFYVTKGTYFGKHGLSLRLEGKDRGFNDKAEARAIVIHGADYIGEHRKSAGYMGRSFGCPAVPSYLSKKVINTIKNGTTLFIYHPSSSYLHGSRILNG
jgi:hypothetical protein